MRNRLTSRQIQKARRVIIFEKAKYCSGIGPKEQDGQMKEKSDGQKM